MTFSKNRIRKLGNSIRLGSHEDVTTEDIDTLEAYRISYKESVSNIFNKLYKESKSLRHDSITTYRLKRIESIIRKLYRFPSMDFDRMWDVAGCRCILNTEDKVYKLRSILYDKFNVVKEKDYYKDVAPTGYKSIHLYLTESPEDKWPIEIQLRTRKDHNWATLVEIVDQLYAKNLKEGEDDPKFFEFFKLMSQLDGLDIGKKLNLICLTHELAVFQKLYSVFIQNYLKVRLNWLELQKPKSDHFFVIEVLGDQPQISSFSSFVEAESSYFHKFSANSGSNIVLTYLPQSNFENLETAYSNYTLTTHTFIDDYFRLLSETCGFLMSEREYKSFYEIFRHAQINFYSNLANIQYESIAIQDVSIKDRSKAKYWKKDFEKRINRRTRQLAQLSNHIEKHRPKKGKGFLEFNYYAWRISTRDKKFQKEFERLFKSY